MASVSVDGGKSRQRSSIPNIGVVGNYPLLHPRIRSPKERIKKSEIRRDFFQARRKETFSCRTLTTSWGFPGGAGAGGTGCQTYKTLWLFNNSTGGWTCSFCPDPVVVGVFGLARVEPQIVLFIVLMMGFPWRKKKACLHDINQVFRLFALLVKIEGVGVGKKKFEKRKHGARSDTN